MEKNGQVKVEAYSAHYIDSLHEQGFTDQEIEERTENLDWIQEAQIVPKLEYAFSNLSGLLKGYLEEGLEIDFPDWKIRFEQRLKFFHSLCIGNVKIMTMVNELLKFSKSNEWNEEIVTEILSRGRHALEYLVDFVERVEVIPGEVYCDTYKAANGKDIWDLGVIRIVKKGGATLRQEVLDGDKTVEGYIYGRGELRIARKNGKKEVYRADKGPIHVFVKIGDIMQWKADSDSTLIAYEICYPPYSDGRYRNLPNSM